MKKIFVSLLLLTSLKLISLEHSHDVLHAGSDSAQLDDLEDSVRIDIDGNEVQGPSPAPIELQDLFANAAIQQPAASVVLDELHAPDSAMPERPLSSLPDHAETQADLDAQASVLLHGEQALREHLLDFAQDFASKAAQIDELTKTRDALQRRIDILEQNVTSANQLSHISRIKVLEGSVANMQNQIAGIQENLKQKASWFSRMRRCLPARLVKALNCCFGDKNAVD